MSRTRAKITLPIVAVANFFFSLALFTTTYINSSYFSTFTGEGGIGFLYIASAILGIGTLILSPYILERFDNHSSLLIALFLAIVSLLSLATFTRAEFVLPVGAIFGALILFIFLSTDLFYEQLSKSEGQTGHIRGNALTITNSALILGPLIAGLLLTNGDYWRVYLMASIFLAIGFMVAFFKFGSYRHPKYRMLSVRKIISHVNKHPDLRKILGAHFLLRMFFAWMVIYLPIYLHQYIGFEWSDIGIIFTIMLLPFVLFELPLGRLADNFWGEKELLLIGLVIMVISTVMIPAMTSTSVIAWAGLLFLTRTGASFVEITTESYFFKLVKQRDISVISTFRIIRPLSYLAAASLGSLALFLFPFHITFLILAFYISLAIPLCLALHDTK